MKVIIVLIILYGVLYTLSIIINRHRLWKQQQLMKELSPKLNEFIASLREIRTNDLSRELNVCKKRFYKSIGTLKNADGQVVNICPKCGDTLTVRDTVFYGRILGCPNYPKCRHFVEVADLNPAVFDTIKVE